MWLVERRGEQRRKSHPSKKCTVLLCPVQEEKKPSEQWSGWMNQAVQGPGVRLSASWVTGRRWVERLLAAPTKWGWRKELCERKTGAFRGYSIPTRVKKWENRESKFGSGDLISPATGWMPINTEAGTGKLGEQSLALTSTWHLNGWESWFVERSPQIKEKGLCSLSNHGILGNVDHLTENKTV